MVQTLSALAAEIDAVLADRPGHFEAFEACEPLFREARSNKLYVAVLHSLLRENLAGKREVTPDISSGPFVVLSASQYSTWALLRHSGRSRRLYMSPSHSMATKVAGAGLTVSTYRLPPIEDAAIFDPAVILSPAVNTELALGQVVTKDAGAVLCDLWTNPGDIAFTLRLNTVPHGDFEWAFDRDTLRPSQISGIRQYESNLTTIFDLLAAARSASSLECLAPFTEHPMHFVRWQATRTIGTIDAAAGLAHVQRLADDKHPDVRAAARQTLVALN